MPSLTPPDDETIRTLYIGGLDSRITEQDLRDQFYAHGEIESIRMVLQRAIAFVTYTTREGAEKAAEELANKLVIKGMRLKLMWGKPQAPKPEEDESGRQGQVSHGGLLPRAVISQQQSGDQPQPPGMEGQQQQAAPASYYFNIPAPPAAERTLYPSMDPQRMGAIVNHRTVKATRAAASRASSAIKQLSTGWLSCTTAILPWSVSTILSTSTTIWWLHASTAHALPTTISTLPADASTTSTGTG